MVWEKISDLLDLARKELEIQKRKEELKQKFKEVFGIEPQKVTVEKAFAEFRDDELPEGIRLKIYDLLNDLGYEYDYFKLYAQIYKTVWSEEHDWRVFTGNRAVTVEKRENKLCYQLEIYPIENNDY